MLYALAMPELPDVIAYIEALRPKIVGRPIERIRVISPFFVRSVEPALDEVAGRGVLELRRIRKRIVFVAVSSPGGRANVARVFKPWRRPPRDGRVADPYVPGRALLRRQTSTLPDNERSASIAPSPVCEVAGTRRGSHTPRASSVPCSMIRYSPTPTF